MGRIFGKILSVFLAVSLPLSAYAFDWPKDLPTFEALMALHKCVKKDEDQALERVAMSFGEQSIVTKGAKKFNDVRSTLDSKLNNSLTMPIHTLSLPVQSHPPHPRSISLSTSTVHLPPTHSSMSAANRSWRGTIRRRMSQYPARSSIVTISMRQWRLPAST